MLIGNLPTPEQQPIVIENLEDSIEAAFRRYIPDPDRYEEYIKLTPAAIDKYGGRFIVRGGDTEILEGEQRFERFVLLEFDSMQQARAWYNSAEYQNARIIRQQASDGFVMIAEGCT